MSSLFERMPKPVFGKRSLEIIDALKRKQKFYTFAMAAHATSPVIGLVARPSLPASANAPYDLTSEDWQGFAQTAKTLGDGTRNQLAITLETELLFGGLDTKEEEVFWDNFLNALKQ